MDPKDEERGNKSDLLPRSLAPALTLLTLLLAGSLLAGCGPGRDARRDAVLTAEIRQWHRHRIEELKQPDGWLTLAGLYWLEEGENRFGSDPDNDLVFPDKAPPHLGSFVLEDSVVRMTTAPGVDVRYHGAPVNSIEMDPGGETADVILEWGSLSWFLIKRDNGLGIRLKDRESSTLAAFDDIETYPIDLAWRIEGRFERYDPPKTVYIPTVLGTDAEDTVPGAAVFEVDGETYRLDVTGAPADSAFFVIFGDVTNGRETYGGGRYLWVDAPKEGDVMIIDFNRAYNPPCVFTPYATCPLPPRQNRLPIRVEAGEKTYKKESETL